MSKIALLEAALFMTARPLSIEELASITHVQPNELEAMIEDLKSRYNNDPESGIMVDDSGGFRLMVKPEYLGHVKSLSPYADLSRGLLRALAIVAYHEPVKQSDIVKVIGNRAYEYIKELEARGLVRAEKASRTKIITTTDNFEKYFGISREKLRQMIGDEHDEGNDINGNRENGPGDETG